MRRTLKAPLRGHSKLTIAGTLLVVAAPPFLACSSDRGPVTGLDPDPGAVVRGRVTAVGGGDVSGLRATWRPTNGSASESMTLAASGEFQLGTATTSRSGELLIDGSSPREFHPFLFPLEADSVLDLDILMVPTTWTITRGQYAGQTVATRLDPVVNDDAQLLLYSYFFARPDPRDAPVRFRMDRLVWPDDHLPVGVALDHRHSTRSFTPEDSAAVWSVLERMEVLFGRDLFRPIVADTLWWPDPWRTDHGPVPGVIRVVWDPPAWRGFFESSASTDVWEGDLGAWAEGGGFTAYQVNTRELDAGSLIVGEMEPFQLADGFIPWETVLMHEALHVLGAGHTCRIQSPQGPCFRTAEPSEFDVAYLELLSATVRLERELDTRLGMLPAIIGERRIELGASALPDFPAR